MAINFPASPNLNDTFVSGGVTYTWDGTVWVSSGPAAFVQKSGDTMTGDLTVPSLISQGDVQTTSLNGGPLAGFRNQIINGDFRVAQRGDDFFQTPPADTDDPYTLDRWCVSTIQAAQPTRVARQNNDAPPGFDWSVALYANGSPAGGERQALLQGIELERVGINGVFAVGTTWTFSYWIKGLAATSIGVECGFRPSPAVGGANPSEFSETTDVTAAWVRHSHTFTIANNADAADACLTVAFYNHVASPTAILIAGVQLEPGPVATPFEQRPIGTELALCERYFELVSGGDGSPLVGDGNGGTTKQTVLPYRTQKRVPSTVTATNAAIKNDGAIVTATLAFGDTNGLGAFIYATSIAGGTWGSSTQIRFTSLSADAEL